MIRRTVLFVAELLELCGTEIYWEWPARSRYFTDPAYKYLGRLLRRRGKILGSARIYGCLYGLRDSHDEHIMGKYWRIDSTDAEFVLEFGCKTCPNTMWNEPGPTNYLYTKLMGAGVKWNSHYPSKMHQSIVHFRFRQLRGHRVTAEATFLARLAASDSPWETTNEFHAVLDLAVDDGSEVPTERDRMRARVVLLRMHRAVRHAHPSWLAQMLIDAKKPAWPVREAQDLVCDICNSLKPGVDVKSDLVSLSALPAQWEDMSVPASDWVAYNLGPVNL